MLEKDEIKSLVRSWHSRITETETDHFYSFLCYWICLNAWLDHQSFEDVRSNGSDKAMIDWLVSKDENESDIIAAYEAMKRTGVGRDNIEKLAQRTPIKDTSRAQRDDIEIDGANDRNNIIKAIYRIRCNLFHGGKSAASIRDNELVEYAGNIMKKWMDIMIRKWNQR